MNLLFTVYILGITMANIFEETARWLKSKHSVSAPVDWLEACINWISSEHGDHTTNDQNSLHELVLEQWLLSDLKEIGAQCLPENLCQEKKFVLNGTYCLQINSVLDVGCSYYSQLQKVQGTENENVHVSATQYNKDEDVKSGRMLMMDLTDGTIDVKAMEYRQMRDVNVNTKLGTKIIVSGKVLCRLGVLMLSGNNVRVIGGEVDSLVCTQEDLLNQALQLKEHFKQEPFSERFKGEGKKYDKDKSYSGHRMDWKTGGIYSLSKTFKSEFRPHQQETAEEVKDMGVDWGDDMDDLLLKQTEVDDQSDKFRVVQYNWNKEEMTRGSSITRPIDQRNGSHLRPNASAKRTSQHFMDDDSDFDPDELEQLEKVIKRENEGFTSSLVNSCVSDGKSKGQEHSAQPEQWAVKQKIDSFEQKGSIVHVQPERGNVKQERLSTEQDFVRVTPVPATIKLEPFTVKKEISKLNQEAFNLAQETVQIKQDSPLCTELGVVNVKQEYLNSSKATEPAFTYLIELNGMVNSALKQRVRTKTYISTLIGKLDFNGGRYWSLLLKINDGTSVMEVSVSDGVLCELIGFQTSDCLRVKQRGSKQEKVTMSEGLKKCQKRLIEMSCFMDLEFGGDLQRPVIVALTPVDSVKKNVFV